MRSLLEMVSVLQHAEAYRKARGGKPNPLVASVRLLMTWEYWREYSMYLHMRPQLQCEREHGVSHRPLVRGRADQGWRFHAAGQARPAQTREGVQGRSD